MGVFKHLVPANILGITPPTNPVTGALILHDVARGIYAQQSAAPATPALVGYVPAASDGSGGIVQLARAVNSRFYSQTTTGFTASIAGTTLTINYPSVPVFWDGAVQTLLEGSLSGTVSTGTWSLVVGYNWGLTDVALVQTSALDPSQNYIELCEVAVNTSTGTAVASNGMVGCRFMSTLCINGPASTAYSVAASDQNGNMPW